MEFVGSLPVLMLGALLCVQALLLALSLVFAQVVADRSARGAERAEAISSVPRPWRSRVSISRDERHARIVVQSPAVLPGVGSRLRVAARSERP